MKNKKEEIKLILENLDASDTHPKDKVDYVNMAVDIIYHAKDEDLISIREIDDERVVEWVEKYTGSKPSNHINI